MLKFHQKKQKNSKRQILPLKKVLLCTVISFLYLTEAAQAVDQQYAAPNANQPSCLAAGIYVTGGVPTGNQTAVGCSAYSLGAYSTAIGANAIASGDSNTAIGGDAFATALDRNPNTVFQSTAIGAKAKSTGYAATSLGFLSNAAGNGSMALGASSQATFFGSTAIGTGAQATAHQSTSIGISAVANASNSTAIGANSSTGGYANSVALGANSINTQSNQIMLGTTNNTYTTPGITSAASRASQSGATKFVSSDSNGNLATSDYGPSDLAQLNNTVSQLSNSVNMLGYGLRSLSTQVQNNRQEARQGIAMAAAMSQAPMPSAPGKTSWKFNNSVYKNAAATSLSIAHRLPTRVPVAVTAGIAVGLKNSAIITGGMQGEF